MQQIEVIKGIILFMLIGKGEINMMQNLDDTKTISSSATITCTPINVGESYSSYFTPTKMTLSKYSHIETI